MNAYGICFTKTLDNRKKCIASHQESSERAKERQKRPNLNKVGRVAKAIRE